MSFGELFYQISPRNEQRGFSAVSLGVSIAIQGRANRLYFLHNESCRRDYLDRQLGVGAAAHRAHCLHPCMRSGDYQGSRWP